MKGHRSLMGGDTRDAILNPAIPHTYTVWRQTHDSLHSMSSKFIVRLAAGEPQFYCQWLLGLVLHVASQAAGCNDKSRGCAPVSLGAQKFRAHSQQLGFVLLRALV